MFENDYTFIGKHATYLKFLAKKNARDDQDPSNPTSAKLFERYIDVYMNAAIWGLLYSRTAERDTISDSRAHIYADAYANERENCIFLYRMAMLLDKTIEMTPEERIDRAFRLDTQPEKAEELKQCLELFHDYVRGGLEIMFEQFTDGCTTSDDYLNKTYEIMTMFKKELEGLSYSDELVKLIR